MTYTTETNLPAEIKPVQLKPLEVKKEELQQLANDYKSLVVTETTLKMANEARKVLKNKRLSIQRIVDANKKTVKELLKGHESDGDELIAIIEPIEQRLASECEKIESDIKNAAQAKIKAEEDRKRAIRDKINGIESKLTVVRNSTSIEEMNAIEEEIGFERDNFEEYNEEGNKMIDTVITSIENRKIFLIEDAKALAIKQANDRLAEKELMLKSRRGQLLALQGTEDKNGFDVRGHKVPHDAIEHFTTNDWNQLILHLTPTEPETEDDDYDDGGGMGLVDAVKDFRKSHPIEVEPETEEVVIEVDGENYKVPVIPGESFSQPSPAQPSAYMETYMLPLKKDGISMEELYPKLVAKYGDINNLEIKPPYIQFDFGSHKVTVEGDLTESQTNAVKDIMDILRGVLSIVK